MSFWEGRRCCLPEVEGGLQASGSSRKKRHRIVVTQIFTEQLSIVFRKSARYKSSLPLRKRILKSFLCIFLIPPICRSDTLRLSGCDNCVYKHLITPFGVAKAFSRIPLAIVEAIKNGKFVWMLILFIVLTHVSTYFSSLCRDSKRVSGKWYDIEGCLWRKSF